MEFEDKKSCSSRFFSTLEIIINLQDIIMYLSGAWDLLKRVQNLVSLDTINSSASDDKCQQQQQSSCPRWAQVHLKEKHIHSLF